jgi:DNA-binding transcriptional LysR family regulator
MFFVGPHEFANQAVPTASRPASGALEHWQKASPGIVIDCLEMDPEAQERALLDGRIAVGILVLTDRSILELLSVQLLMRHAVTVALPKSHPQAVLPETRLPIRSHCPTEAWHREMHAAKVHEALDRLFPKEQPFSSILK